MTGLGLTPRKAASRQKATSKQAKPEVYPVASVRGLSAAVGKPVETEDWGVWLYEGKFSGSIDRRKRHLFLGRDPHQKGAYRTLHISERNIKVENGRVGEKGLEHTRLKECEFSIAAPSNVDPYDLHLYDQRLRSVGL